MKQNPYQIGPVDDARRERLLQLDGLFRSNSTERLEIRFPSPREQQRAGLSNFGNEGPSTKLLGLGDQLADYSKLIKNGASVVSHDRFEDLVAPVVDRSLQASWGNSGDLDNTPLTVADAKPKRLSAYITISDQLRVQNPILAGSFIEAQLLASIGTALDDAAINGTGVGDIPLGILNDASLPTHTRGVGSSEELADLTKMEEIIADAHGEIDPSDYRWLCDPATRKRLRETPGYNVSGNFGGAAWDASATPQAGGGILGYHGVALPTAPNDTLILTQMSQLAVLDWSVLKIENLIDRTQALAGFRTMLVSGFFDFAVIDPNAICIAINPV